MFYVSLRLPVFFRFPFLVSDLVLGVRAWCVPSTPFFDGRRDSEVAGRTIGLDPESDLAARHTEFKFIRVVLLGLGVIRITSRPTCTAAPQAPGLKIQEPGLHLCRMQRP